MPGQAGHDEKEAGHDEKEAGHDEREAGHDGMFYDLSSRPSEASGEIYITD